MKVNDQVYGKQPIDNEIIKKLINTKEMQRLKGIHQHGTWHIMNPNIDTSRFEHSLGVYFLLRKFNASLEEQIAGLIHDVSHFPFSHVIDYVFGERDSQEFAEKFHKKIIKNSSICAILKENKIDIEFILDKHNFKMLENNLPDICADRLDYLFRDSLIFKNLNHKIVENLLGSLIVNSKEFIINNEENAKKIARLYLEMSKAMWINPLQSASYQILADAIKIAFDKGIIKEKDFHSIDIEVLKKLENSKNEKIIEMINILKNLKIKEVSRNDYDFHTTGKARYIDPKFLGDNNIKRVSDVDEKFKNDIKQFQQWVKKGFYIKIIR